MLTKLITNEGWEFAIIHFKSRQPLAVEQASCKCAQKGNNVSIEVTGSDMPHDKTKRGIATHIIDATDVVSVAYYVESRIAKV
jgi:hypothetical protein